MTLLRLSRFAQLFACCGIALGGAGAASAQSHANSGADYVWQLPGWVPRPVVPADNPMTAEKVTLGRFLFYDKRFSQNGQMACATCHEQKQAFAEKRAVAIGVTLEKHPRNSMSLANVAYVPRLTWANPLLHSLEQQALIPLFGETPVEMGLAGKEDALTRLLKRDPRYEKLFKAAFPNEPGPYTLAHLTRALASFQRSLVSFDSPYDRYRYGGQARAISRSAKRGEKLFFSEKFECFHCHGGINFSDSVKHAKLGFEEVSFHNTGLYNLDGKGAYPAHNRGIMELTLKPEDMGRFRAPTLRNIALTAPYMHDGSITTLDSVLDHYAAGGRAAQKAHGGAANPLRSEFVKGFTLSATERADLLAFLNSLTDARFVTNPAHADPFVFKTPTPKKASNP